jgi:hypothetical protein
MKQDNGIVSASSLKIMQTYLAKLRIVVGNHAKSRSKSLLKGDERRFMAPVD